jgi:hypothetical protein
MVTLGATIQDTIDRELPYLQALTDATASAQPAKPDGWSPKEELGHLIDSATNNHIRFVRAALEGDIALPGYAQDGWVRLHAYKDRRWADLVSLWHSYNALLATLIVSIPDNCMSSTCTIGANPPVTLGFLIDDYVLHMRHHLDHLLGREVITRYPGAVA